MKFSGNVRRSNMFHILAIALIAMLGAQSSWASPRNPHRTGSSDGASGKEAPKDGDKDPSPKPKDGDKPADDSSGDTAAGDSSSNDTFKNLASKFTSATAACGLATGATAFALVVDTVPLTGMAKSAGWIHRTTKDGVKYVFKFLKEHELPYIVALIKAVEPMGAGFSNLPAAGRIGDFLVKAATKTAAVGTHVSTHVGTQGLYVVRVGGTLLGLRADSPKDVAGYVNTLAPHIMGGAITAVMDYGVFKLGASLGMDRSNTPEGTLTREALRATSIALHEGFLNEDGICKVAWTNLNTAVDEINTRSGMNRRLGQAKPKGDTTDSTPDSSTNTNKDNSPKTDAPALSNKDGESAQLAQAR